LSTRRPPRARKLGGPLLQRQQAQEGNGCQRKRTGDPPDRAEHENGATSLLASPDGEDGVILGMGRHLHHQYRVA
jgi:hypothetical protein